MLKWFRRITRHAGSVQLILLIVVLLLLGSFATTCRSESIIQVEGGSTLSRGYTPALGLTIVWPESGPGDADFQCGLMLVGTSEFKTNNPNQAAVQCLIVDGYKRFDLGLGIVALQNTDDYNSSHTNFSLLAGYRFTDRLGVIYRHWSNAGTTKPNIGRDMLLLTYRF